MNDGMLESFRHNTWATVGLLEFCEDLKPDQLEARSDGTYGSILSTLQHIVGAEGRYRFRLSGEGSKPPADDEITDLAELRAKAEEHGRFWEELFSKPFDPDRVIIGKTSDLAEFEVCAGVIAAQCINHGNEHRSQIFTVLTTIGMEPPSLDGWAWGQATGRFKMEAPT
jgi:uncharacterized damage-inducible protein DinB